MLVRRTLLHSWMAATSTFSSLASSSNSGSIEPHRQRSNATHLTWEDGSVQSIADAHRESYAYLRNHVMAFEEPFLETLGFHNDTTTDDIDGLADGLVNSVIRLSLQAKMNFTYTDDLPKHIWQEYVLNYANLNEARSNIRPLLHERLIKKLLLNDTSSSRSLPETLNILHEHMWTVLAPSTEKEIHFVAGQTPAIFDPMSVLTFGYASCTGLAILMVHVLRAAGIPSRVVGTDAWNGNVTAGNHNWVEVFWKEWWYFFEPGGGGTIDLENYQQWWFCTRERMHNTTLYAARLTPPQPHFPLAWERTCQSVPAENRTLYYQRVCTRGSATESTLQE